MAESIRIDTTPVKSPFSPPPQNDVCLLVKFLRTILLSEASLLGIMVERKKVDATYGTHYRVLAFRHHCHSCDG